MKQKLDELARKKSLLVFMGVAVLVLGFLVFYVYSQQKAQRRAMEEKRRAAPVVVQRQEDIYKEQWIAESQQELAALRKEQEELRRRLEEEQRQKEELQRILSQPRREIMSDLIFIQRQERQEGPSGQQVRGETLRVQPKFEDEKSFVIPAGSFVRVLILSGVDAPTSGQAQASPHPVLLRIVDRAVLPNLYRADIRDCFLIGSAYGDLSSERAYIRLEVLSCVTRRGDVVEAPVRGYLAGEDGKVGLVGRVVTKQGQILARALMAGFIEGIGRAFQTSTTNIVVSPQGTLQTVDPSRVFQGSLAMGFSNAASKLVEQYNKLLDMMFPVIEINAGRVVDAVFLQRVEFRVVGGRVTVSQPPGQNVQPQQNDNAREEF